MALPVTGSPLHDSAMMTATMAATRTAPAMLRVRSRESACRISVTFNQLLSWPARRGRRRPRLGGACIRYHPTNDPPLTLTVWPVT